MYAINYNGLRKRETYESLTNYLQNDQDKIRYPDRKAIRIRDDPTIATLLDGKGEGVLKKMEEQRKQKVINKQIETIIEGIASRTNTTLHSVKGGFYSSSSTPIDYDEIHGVEERSRLQAQLDSYNRDLRHREEHNTQIANSHLQEVSDAEDDATEMPGLRDIAIGGITAGVNLFDHVITGARIASNIGNSVVGAVTGTVGGAVSRAASGSGSRATYSGDSSPELVPEESYSSSSVVMPFGLGGGGTKESKMSLLARLSDMNVDALRKEVVKHKGKHDHVLGKDSNGNRIVNVMGQQAAIKEILSQHGHDYDMAPKAVRRIRFR
jgi:hypothetical protein